MQLRSLLVTNENVKSWGGGLGTRVSKVAFSTNQTKLFPMHGYFSLVPRLSTAPVCLKRELGDEATVPITQVILSRAIHPSGPQVKKFNFTTQCSLYLSGTAVTVASINCAGSVLEQLSGLSITNMSGSLNRRQK